MQTLAHQEDTERPGGRSGYQALHDLPAKAVSSDGEGSMASNAPRGRGGPSRAPSRVGIEEDAPSRRPQDVALYQQKFSAWSPYLTPWKAAFSFLLIGVLFVPLGVYLGIESDDIVEYR